LPKPAFGDTADAALLDGLYTAKRRLYKAAVKVARAQRLPLQPPLEPRQQLQL
jgi:hypothetical protein